MKSFKAYNNESLSPDDSMLQEVLDLLVDHQLIHESLLAEGKALRTLAKTAGFLQAGRALQISSRIRQSNADPGIKLLAQQLNAIAALTLLTLALSSDQPALASKAKSLGGRKG